ncbi:unnamed protein product [Euphydryas editha]|uniref:Uncharacterized protein n=1 Tax=Euphydryas editha TaxID=104508 RepID=A0AAU9UPP6_EUPED|nr:unnamed protein product [Euphydryas editha]
MLVDLFQVPYRKRRLVESAVPTIFDKLTTTLPSVSDKPMDGVFDCSNSVKDECESLEDPLMDNPDAESADASSAMPRVQQETVKHKVLPVTSVYFFLHILSFTHAVSQLSVNVVVTLVHLFQVRYKHVRLVESAVPTIFNNFTTSVPAISDKPADGVFDGLNSVKDECESFEDPLMDNPDAESADASSAMPRVPEETVKYKVRYKHVRLVESVVPTIFNNFTTSVPPISDKPADGVFDASNSVKDECESLEAPLMDTPNAESADGSCAMPCALPKTVKQKVYYIQPRLVKSVVPIIFNNFTTSVPPISDKPTDGVFDGSNSVKDECESLEDPLMDTSDAESADASCAMPRAPQKTVQHEVLPVTPVSSAASTSPKQEVVNSDSIVHRKNFVLSKITINDLTSNTATSEKNPITIPPSWGVTEYEEQRGQRVVFSCILRTNTNGTASTIINKSVEVEADKKLRYCVYGLLLDSERYQLPPVLTDTSQLPEILKEFRRLNVCDGIGPVNIHHLMVDCVFQDSVQRWRDNNCTILAKQKRCKYCKKMRHCIIMRESRSKKTENIHRIRHLSNPIDRRKLNALRKKMSQEKRANNYLKRRVQLLTELLQGKAKE